ncbi:MAG: Ig-like domain-containing protein [Promethearchaeota archaeon]
MKFRIDIWILILAAGLILAPLAPLLEDSLPLDPEDGLRNDFPYSSSNLQIFEDISRNEANQKSEILTTPIKILFDEAHTSLIAGGFAPGPVSMMGAFLREIGFEPEANMDKELTPEYLASYQILAIFFPQGKFSASEITAIIEFVQSGGSLLVSGKGGWIYDPFVKINSSNLNDITREMNVTYFDYFSSTDEHLQNFLNHPLVTNVSKVYLQTNIGKFTIDSGVNITILANQSTGDPAFAFREFGEGRVFFSCSESPFGNLKGSYTEDHFQFVANVFNWLAKETITDVEDPGWMTVPILKNYTTTETRRRNYKMLLGVTHVHCTEGSGDSDTPVSEQIERARACDLEFFALTDHQGGTPQASWEPARTYLEDNNIKDLNILYGVEGDVQQVGHQTVFGITEIINPVRVPTLDEWPGIVDTYHTQGGVVFIAHPLGCCGIPLPARVNYINNLVNSNLDGFEIANAGYFAGGDRDGGLGEWAYLMPFTGGSDAHSPFSMNRTLMYVFVEENTDEAIIEAILDRRALVINYFNYDDLYNNLVIGDQQWLDEFIYRNHTAYMQYEIVSSLIANASLAGWDVSSVNTKLASAKRAIRNFNHDKAQRIFGEILDSLYTIEVTTDSTEYNVGDQITVSVSVYDQTSAAVPVSATAELLNRNRTRILSTTSIINENAEEATLILDIPVNSTSGTYPVNILLSINGTLVKKRFELGILADTTPPTVAITSPPHQETINQTSVDVKWTVLETGSGLYSQIISVDGSQIAELTETTARSYTLTLTEGTHTIKVQAIDLAGNIGEDEVQITVKTSVATTTTTSSTAVSTPAFSWVIITVTLVIAITRERKNK